MSNVPGSQKQSQKPSLISKRVAAKFYVQNINPTPADHPHAPAYTITLGAVCRGANNAEWASATPSGSITMTVRNEVAVAQFRPGVEYYVVFEEAEPKPALNDEHPLVEGITPWGTPCCATCGGVPTFDATLGYVWDDLARSAHEKWYGKPSTPAAAEPADIG